MAPAAREYTPAAVDDSATYARLADELEAVASSGAAACDNDTRKRLLAAVKLALPELETQDDTVQRIMYTPLEVVAARIGVNINLFTRLVESPSPLTTKDLADPIGANPALLERLLKYIASLHYIKEVDVGTWAPSKTTRHLAPRGVAGAAHHFTTICGPAHLATADWLEKTKYQQPTVIEDSAFSHGHRVHQGIFQWLGEHPESFHEFNQFMTVQRFARDKWLDAMHFDSVVLKGADPEAPLFIDIGGGMGHQCQALLTQYPDIAGRVILQDMAQVIKDALPVEGMKTQAIDFFKEIPVKNARVYYMRNVLHDWTDEYCGIILKNIKDAMGPNSMLFIDEMVIPTKGAHKIAMQLDIAMLANCISEERSEARWSELLKTVGFKVDHLFTYNDELSDSIMVCTPV